MRSQKEFPSNRLGFAVVFKDDFGAMHGKTIRNHCGEWFEVIEEGDGNVATPITEEKLNKIKCNDTAIYFV